LNLHLLLVVYMETAAFQLVLRAEQQVFEKLFQMFIR